MRTMPEAVIVATARSPIGRAFKGNLKEIRPDDLTVQIIRAALGKVSQLDPADIDDLMLGCGLPGGEQGFNIARVTAVLLGYDHLPGTTVTRYCSPPLQTTRMAFHAIKAGEGDVFISAGLECVSRFATGSSDSWPDTHNPLFADAQARTAKRSEADADMWRDPRSDGAIPDVYIAMGQTAENVAALRGITRQQQDEFGVRSQNLAEKAIANGFWQREITPVTMPDGSVIAKDDGPRPVSALSPEIMGLGPVDASRRALARAGMTIGDMDLVEINEAFAAQVIPSYSELGIDLDRLNVNGGAIAVGHPFGMTGARIATTLINSLQFHDKTFGLETMCVGGGQGMAMIFERLN